MKSGKPLKRSPLKPGKPLARTSRLKHGKKGFYRYKPWDRVEAAIRVADRDGGCCRYCLTEHGLDLHHVLPKRVLRKHGHAELVDDAANLMLVCREDHEAHETRYRPLPWELLPASAVDFADALGLLETLIRMYPSAKEATA